MLGNVALHLAQRKEVIVLMQRVSKWGRPIGDAVGLTRSVAIPSRTWSAELIWYFAGWVCGEKA